MRLLKLTNNGKFGLETFSHTIPPYAILSHTWGSDSDEVTFKDIEEGAGEEKPGYQKLVFCGLEARAHGLPYFWVDTCCIDKSSSAELSESINSMFQWYQNAEVCYAYLSDISADGDDQHTMDQIRTSRWFTRGWTLQELLAPLKVSFFDQSWKFLGDKSALCGLLQEITKVNFGAMTWPWTLPSYSIATRMCWVSSRTTTRIEDQAYCMLGILGVHMPLLYGEGENAFRRLQEELIKTSDDETIFAHSGRNILARCPQEFFSGHHLTALKKSESTPYFITNAGLHIRMRVLKHVVDDESASDQDVSALGILNCHYNTDSSRNEYLALPLQLTAMENTYRRAPFSIQSVEANIATAVEHCTIFIQLKPVQISRLTLLEDWNNARFSARVSSTGSSVVHNSRKREIRIYPTPPFEYELVRHTFRLPSMSCKPFDVVTFFDLAMDKAGVLVLPSYVSSKDHKAFDSNTAFRTWKSQGRPTCSELLPSLNLGERINVMVTQTEEIKQFVWSLHLEMLED